ncbi:MULTISPECIES: DNA-binding protein [unclassified Pandoraea]|uniref:DNA-binding protein n=1 Tax=unclassified Pandoraea TaxID=2624094 RepID=UPI000B401376|nr:MULTISPECIES: DNA-binding protein [unclassified Pandoraea]
MADRPNIEKALRLLLSGDERKAAMEVLNWDASQVSRFLSGQNGIPIDKLDQVIYLTGFVMVTPRYLEGLASMAETGVGCRCAREGGGECGFERRVKVLPRAA